VENRKNPNRGGVIEGNALAVAVQSHSGEEDPEEEGSEEKVVAEKPPGLRTKTRKGAYASHTLTQ
jgi:hypothetical protein